MNLTRKDLLFCAYLCNWIAVLWSASSMHLSSLIMTRISLIEIGGLFVLTLCKLWIRPFARWFETPYRR